VRLPFLPGEDPFNVLVVKEAVEFFPRSVLFLKSGKKRVIGVEIEATRSMSQIHEEVLPGKERVAVAINVMRPGIQEFRRQMKMVAKRVVCLAVTIVFRADHCLHRFHLPLSKCLQVRAVGGRRVGADVVDTEKLVQIDLYTASLLTDV
jgi:hypothetical protein